MGRVFKDPRMIRSAAKAWSARAAIALAAATVATGSFAQQSSEIAFRRLDPASFQTFVVNWDEKASPFLCALVDSSAQWAKVMHPAPTMSQTKPFAPEPALFETKDILLVSRVVPGGPGSQQAVAIRTIRRAGQDLQVTVATKAPPSASFSVKAAAMAELPKTKTGTVSVLADDRTVCRVMPGQNWVYPRGVADRP